MTLQDFTDAELLAEIQERMARPKTERGKPMMTRDQRNAKALHGLAEIVGKEFRVSPDEIIQPGRLGCVVPPRQFVMALLRQEMQLSFAEIAGLMGLKEHGSVMHAQKSVDKRLKSDSAINKLFTTRAQRVLANPLLNSLFD